MNLPLRVKKWICRKKGHHTITPYDPWPLIKAHNDITGKKTNDPGRHVVCIRCGRDWYFPRDSKEGFEHTNLSKFAKGRE